MKKEHNDLIKLEGGLTENAINIINKLSENDIRAFRISVEYSKKYFMDIEKYYKRKGAVLTLFSIWFFNTAYDLAPRYTDLLDFTGLKSSYLDRALEFLTERKKDGKKITYGKNALVKVDNVYYENKRSKAYKINNDRIETISQLIYPFMLMYNQNEERESDEGIYEAQEQRKEGEVNERRK